MADSALEEVAQHDAIAHLEGDVGGLGGDVLGDLLFECQLAVVVDSAHPLVELRELVLEERGVLDNRLGAWPNGA